MRNIEVCVGAAQVLFDSVRTKHAMVASFEHPMATWGSKRTDTHLASHHSTGRTSPDQIGRSPSPSYMSDQMLWYRSDGYYSPRPTTPMGLMDDTVSRPWGAATASRPQTAIGGFGGRDWGAGMDLSATAGSDDYQGGGAGAMGDFDPALTVTGREIFTRERTSMFATLGPKPPDMQATLERSARAPSWQGPKSGWATHLLPKRPGAFAESLCGKTSRPITARERDEWSPRRPPSRHHPIGKPEDRDPIWGVKKEEIKELHPSQKFMTTSSWFFSESGGAWSGGPAHMIDSFRSPTREARGRHSGAAW